MCAAHQKSTDGACKTSNQNGPAVLHAAYIATDLTLLSRRKVTQNSVGNRNLDRSRGTLEEPGRAQGGGMRGLRHSVRTQSAAVVRGTHSLRDADLQKHFFVNI